MILNLTQHAATAEQTADRLIDISADGKTHLIDLLTFDSIPEEFDISEKAKAIADLATLEASKITPDDDGIAAMIGGAQYLMGALEDALKEAGFEVCYAFTKRISAEQPQPDGSVKKVSVFKHGGYVFV